jgi:hypothetical protein
VVAFYYCSACNEIFPESEIASDVESVTSKFWGARATTVQEFPICPCCGGELDEAPTPHAVESCCDNEVRDLNGGCVNCGDPCL